MPNNKKIFVAGAAGMVGSAIVRALTKKNYNYILMPKKSELNLLDFNSVKNYLNENRPDYIFMAAAKVGGINANDKYSAEFLYENIQIQNNIIHCAHLLDINDLLFLGSSCAYPKYADQPIKEEYLLTGKLEPTNEAYAIAKISGIKMCEHYKKQYERNYFGVMPTNLYGCNDNFDLINSHVIPAIMRKAHIVKEKKEKKLVIWGSGKVRREFLYVDDLAEACIYLMENNYSGSLINIGTGKDMTIDDLAKKIMIAVGIDVELTYDNNFPDGTPQKVLDVSKINKLGWIAKTSIEEGLKKIYENEFLR